VSALVAMGRSADLRWRGMARAELQNPEAAMRREAARTCGELEVSAAQRDLLLLLDDDELDVRLAAIYALGRIGGQQAQEALRIMEQSEEPQEAEAATLALEEILFYGGTDIALHDDLDEGDDSDDWDLDIWGDEDEDLGEYGD
jgi:HEAT repeat protein